MPDEKAMLMEQLQMFEELIPKIDAIYGRLTRTFKMMSPILKKKTFNSDDQSVMKDFLHNVHQELEEYGQSLRRGQGERDLLRGEILRLKSQNPKAKDEYAIVEAELWAAEKNLSVREKGLGHLSELVQLLDSIMRVGEMTEFDERLLTEIVTDLKNLAE
ncbi:MAG: hypothetical protein U1F57_00565 [bacterium]